MTGGQILGAWDRFWFAEASPDLYARLRIALGLCVVAKVTGLNGIFRIHRLNPTLPWNRPLEGDDWLGNGEYVPRIAGLGWIPVPDDGDARAIAGATLVFGLAMVVGAGTRVAVPLSTALVGWLAYYSSMDYRHHENVLFWMLLVLCAAPCGDLLSVDGWLRRRGGGEHYAGGTRSRFPLRMMQVLVTAIYLSTTWGKLGDGWWTGDAMREMHDGPHMRGPFVAGVWQTFGPVFLSRYTLLVEGLCAFGLWVPVLRLPTVLLGTALHLGIDSIMSVTTFSYQMIASYMAFLDPQPGAVLVRLPPRLRLLRAPLHALDWLGRIRLEEAGTFAVSVRGGPLQDGRRAWGQILRRLPLTSPIGLALLPLASRCAPSSSEPGPPGAPDRSRAPAGRGAG